MSELIAIKISDFEADLFIAQSYLTDNGIHCVINKEYLTVSTPDGGAARLEVLSEDYERAVELLIEGGFAKREDFE